MAAAPDHPPAAGAGTLALITTGVTAIVTSVTMIGPLLVDIARDLGISLGQAGLLAAAAAAPQALGSPFAGLLSDRYGRRPMILLALGSVGVLGFVAAVAPTFLALVVVRFAAGLLGSICADQPSWPPSAISSRPRGGPGRWVGSTWGSASRRSRASRSWASSVGHSAGAGRSSPSAWRSCSSSSASGSGSR